MEDALGKTSQVLRLLNIAESSRTLKCKNGKQSDNRVEKIQSCQSARALSGCPLSESGSSNITSTLFRAITYSYVPVRGTSSLEPTVTTLHSIMHPAASI